MNQLLATLATVCVGYVIWARLSKIERLIHNMSDEQALSNYRMSVTLNSIESYLHDTTSCASSFELSSSDELNPKRLADESSYVEYEV
jgi:hypothetical protein